MGTMHMGQAEQRIALLQEMISCHSDIYMWCYDEQGKLLKSNCPTEEKLSFVYSLFGCREKMFAHGAESGMPLCFGTEFGISWASGYYREEGRVKRMYVIGPYWSTEASFGDIHQALAGCKELELSVEQTKMMTEILEKLPVLSPLLSKQFTVMLHYCVTGEKVKISDIVHWHKDFSAVEGKPVEKDRNKVWEVEKSLMKMVQEGDLNYKAVLNHSSTVSTGVLVQVADLMRQAKDSVIVSVSLCTRAAINGGLPPEQAYSLGDAYIQRVEDARTNSEISAIHDTMYEDFVRRVHKCRSRPKLSRTVQECCDYVQTHTEDKISISRLAMRTGYSEYYLSRKFKAETGISLNDYIKRVKVERAKVLLRTTDCSIQEISDRLNFCSRSHFGETFRKVASCSPGEFRYKAE